MNQNKKEKNDITVRQYFTALIKSAIGKSDALLNLEHNLTKGALRECIVSDILSEILPSQFKVGTGIIVNGMENKVSKQTLLYMTIESLLLLCKNISLVFIPSKA